MYEKGTSVLIVTINEVSKGAKQDCKARGYSIYFAELKSWSHNIVPSKPIKFGGTFLCVDQYELTEHVKPELKNIQL